MKVAFALLMMINDRFGNMIKEEKNRRKRRDCALFMNECCVYCD